MAEIQLSPASMPSLSSSLPEVAARCIAVGPAACRAMGTWHSEMQVAQCFVSTEPGQPTEQGQSWVTLDAVEDSAAALQDSADAVADKVLAWLRTSLSECTGLVVDTSTRAARITGLTLARRLQAAGIDVLAVVLSARLHQGAEVIQQSRHAHAQLHELCNASMLIDGARFAPLDDPAPYVQHVCDTLLQAVNEYGHINVDVQDIFSALCGRNSHMAHAVVQRGPRLVQDLLEQLTQGRLMTVAELRCARAALVLVDAAHGQLKLSDARDIMQTISSMMLPDVHFIYGSGYSQRPEAELGITLLISY